MRRTALASKSEGGFTLIELLIIIIVLGILAAIVVISVGSTRRDAAVAACTTGVKSVELSAEAYNTRMNHYPDTQTEVHGADAMLKSWPISDLYSLSYAPTGYSAGPPVVHASGFTVTIKDSDGTAIASCVDL